MHNIVKKIYALLSIPRLSFRRHDERESILALLLKDDVNINDDIDGTTALMAVGEIGIDIWYLKVLFDHGADPNKVDKRGKTALHMFIEYEVDPTRLTTLRPIHRDSVVDIVQVFLEYKTDISIVDYAGNTVNDHIACASGPLRFLCDQYYDRNISCSNPPLLK